MSGGPPLAGHPHLPSLFLTFWILGRFGDQGQRCLPSFNPHCSRLVGRVEARRDKPVIQRIVVLRRVLLVFGSDLRIDKNPVHIVVTIPVRCWLGRQGGREAGRNLSSLPSLSRRLCPRLPSGKPKLITFQKPPTDRLNWRFRAAGTYRLLLSMPPRLI